MNPTFETIDEWLRGLEERERQGGWPGMVGGDVCSYADTEDSGSWEELGEGEDPPRSETSPGEPQHMIPQVEPP